MLRQYQLLKLLVKGFLGLDTTPQPLIGNRNIWLQLALPSFSNKTMTQSLEHPVLVTNMAIKCFSLWLFLTNRIASSVRALLVIEFQAPWAIKTKLPIPWESEMAHQGPLKNNTLVHPTKGPVLVYGQLPYKQLRHRLQIVLSSQPTIPKAIYWNCTCCAITSLHHQHSLSHWATSTGNLPPWSFLISALHLPFSVSSLKTLD